jgi:predicted MPP superfamily phosphohydrolase
MRGNIKIILIWLVLIAVVDTYAFTGFRVLIQDLTPWLKKSMVIAYWSLTAFVIISLLMFNYGHPESWPKGFRNVVFMTWILSLITKLFFIFFLLIDDIWRAMQWLWYKFQGGGTTEVVSSEGKTIPRSEFLMKAAALFSAIPLVGMTYGMISGAHDYIVRRQKVKIKDLPDAFVGLRIVHISDIHVGSFQSKEPVRRGIQKILDQKPDVVFFTGDLVNNEASEMEGWVKEFARIQAPLGVFSVLGNHDYGDYKNWETIEEKRNNLQRLKNIHAEMGWRLLVNENHVLNKDGQQLAILGIENWGAKGRFPKYGKMKEAYQGTEKIPVKLLLSHDPSHWDAQVRTEYKDIQLMFAGHTHGMQFGIDNQLAKWSPVQYMYKQWSGLYIEEGQQLYVNRGFGYIGYPGRIGITPEITVIELEKA